MIKLLKVKAVDSPYLLSSNQKKGKYNTTKFTDEKMHVG